MAAMAGLGYAMAGTAAFTAIGYTGGLSHDVLERRSYFFKEQAVIKLHGKDLHWVGAVHTLGTFRGHEAEIEKQVANSEFVILEYFDKNIAQYAHAGESTDQMTSLLFQASQYFAGIASVCAKFKKDIVVVNPDTVAAEAFDSFLLWGLPIGLAMKMVVDRDAGNLTTRRAFMQSLLAIPSIARWMSEGGTRGLRKDLRGNTEPPSPSRENEANALGVTVIDWRDVITAKGVDMALKRFGSKGSQPVFSYHGAAHKGTLEYLVNPELRKQKENAYGVHDLFGDISLRRYRFDTKLKEWMELERLPLENS